jgi:hypothetical protein
MNSHADKIIDLCERHAHDHVADYAVYHLARPSRSRLMVVWVDVVETSW